MFTRIFACALALSAGSALSAATFTDSASFLGATSGLGFNDFENEALSGSPGSGALSSIDFGDFLVSSTPDAVKVLNQPFFGADNTTPGGSQYLYIDTDVGFQGSLMTMTFDEAVTSVGFSYTSLGRNGSDTTITINGDVLTLAPIRVGDTQTERFFGFTSTTAFSSFTIDSNEESAYGIDELYYGDGMAAVPLPAALPLLLLGLGGMTALRRRS